MEGHMRVQHAYSEGFRGSESGRHLGCECSLDQAHLHVRQRMKIIEQWPFVNSMCLYDSDIMI